MKLFSRRTVAKNSLGLFAARGVDIAFGFVTVALLTRYLGPEGYGRYTWLWALVLFFQPIVNFELDKILIREIAAHRHSASRLIGSVLAFKGLLFLGFTVVMTGVAWTLGETPVERWCLVLAIVSEGFFHLVMVWTAVFNGFERMEWDTALTTGSRAATLGFLGAVVFFKLPLPWVFGAIAAGNVLRAGVGWVLVRSRFTPISLELPPGGLGLLALEAWPLALAATLTHTAFKIDIYILQWLRGPAEVGLFQLPHQLIFQLQIVPLAIGGAFFPVLSRVAVHEPEAMGRLVGRLLLGLGGIGVLLAAGIGFLSPWMVRIIGGEAFVPSASALQVLAWTVPVLFLNYLMANTLTALHLQKHIPLSSALVLAVNLVLDLLLVPPWGFLGASVGTLAAYTAGVVWLAVVLRRGLKYVE